MASTVAKNLEKFEGFSKEDLHSVHHLNCLEIFAHLRNTKDKSVHNSQTQPTA